MNVGDKMKHNTLPGSVRATCTDLPTPILLEFYGVSIN